MIWTTKTVEIDSLAAQLMGFSDDGWTVHSVFPVSNSHAVMVAFRPKASEPVKGKRK